MTDYVRAVWEQVKWDSRAVALFILAVVVFCGSAVTLMRGPAHWASLALFVASGLFATLCIYLIRLDVRRARAAACQRYGTTSLPRAWDHLEVLVSITGPRCRCQRWRAG